MSNPYRLSNLAIIIVFISLAWFLMQVVWPATQRPLRGFAAYYTASKLLINGQIGPQAYDDAWFNEQLQHEVQHPMHEVFSPTLPTVSWLMLPLIWLPPQTARNVWTWSMAGLFLATLGLLVYIMYQQNGQRPQPLLWSAFVSLALIFPGTAANFHEDQTLIFFFFLFGVSFWGVIQQNQALAGSALGLAFILKTTGAALWLFFFVRRQGSALIWGGGTVLAIFLLSLPWIGSETWLMYAQEVGRVSNSPIKAVTAYQTTAGLFEHLFRFDAQWNPAPLVDWPILARLLTVTVMGLTTLITLWVGRQAKPAMLFAMLVILSVILLPVAEEHHFVMMLIPIFLLMDRLVKQRSKGAAIWLEGVIFVGAMFLLIAPIPYESPALSLGWLALLAYPRLYGSWLLWLLLMRAMLSEKMAHGSVDLSRRHNDCSAIS